MFWGEGCQNCVSSILYVFTLTANFTTPRNGVMAKFIHLFIVYNFAPPPPPGTATAAIFEAAQQSASRKKRNIKNIDLLEI